MSKPWWHFIKDKKSYDTLVSTGMAWEMLPDLPFNWEECEAKLKDFRMEVKDNE